jgi:hypothetical protein
MRNLLWVLWIALSAPVLADEQTLTINRVVMGVVTSSFTIVPSEFDFCQHPGSYRIGQKSFTIKIFHVSEGDGSYTLRCGIYNAKNTASDLTAPIPGTLVFQTLHLSPHGSYFYDSEKPNNGPPDRAPWKYTLDGRTYTGAEDLPAGVGASEAPVAGAGAASAE